MYKKRVIFISEHYIKSKRKAGFHFLAREFWKRGWEVFFVTSYVSVVSLLRPTQRFPKSLWRDILKEARRIIKVEKDFYSYVWLTPWHPFNLEVFGLGKMDWFFRRIFANYGRLSLGNLSSCLRDCSLFIFESTPGIMLFDQIREQNQRARYVYRVSDDLKLLRRHPLILETEQRIAPHFDLISTPSIYLYQKFSSLPNAALHYHGLDKEVFDREIASPYEANTINCIFVGNSFLDVDFLQRASVQFPHYRFHVIGPFQGLPAAPNITVYGEMEFSKTIPYVKHASIGLHSLFYSKGAESFTDTLKVIQYTYCRLPIVAPEFLRTDRPHFFYYTPGDDDSIRSALQNALEFDRKNIDTTMIKSWSELAAVLAGDLW